jgi:hypothetical protein
MKDVSAPGARVRNWPYSDLPGCLLCGRFRVNSGPEQGAFNKPDL